jgi:20S proteasome alpha/beta subunit
LGRQNKRELRIGTVVTFDDNRKGLSYKGTVVAIKRKNVVVLAAQKDNSWLRHDTRYNVPATLIKMAA